MAEKKQLILVPWDFSQIAEYALQHAVKFAKTIPADISFVHIIKKAKEAGAATNKLNVIAEETFKKYGVKPGVIVREGSIFKVINEVIEEVGAELVVMGTHGMKGMQKFTGSWALKVIAGSKAPFVVVQAPPQEQIIDAIVFPLDFRSEDKEKLKWASFLYSHFGTVLKICYQDVSDPLLKKKVLSNIYFSRQYLDERKIKYEITPLDGKANFAQETMAFAKEVNSSLILIVTTKHISFQDYVLGADEQLIISNPYKIPVMCINPRTDITKGRGRFS